MPYDMNNLKIKKQIPLLIHILFCIAILAIPLLAMSSNGITQNVHYIGYMIRTGVILIIFYINYLVLIDKFLFKKQFFIYFIINVILLIGLVFLQDQLFAFMREVNPKPTMPKMPRPPQEMRILGDYVALILSIGMSLAVKVTRRWYNDSINLEALKASQLEADLKNLRSQLNPHFLFNTLNNIYSLIAIDSNKAQESVLRLSNLLRYVLYENDHNFVPLDKELAFTQNYIDLMRLRLSSNVKLNVAIKNEGCDKEIASLLFITLIENAFKHGINNGADSFIDIRIYVDNNQGVLCTVENSLGETNDQFDSNGSGIGLTNLEQRLSLIYPNNHELRIERRSSSFFVLLTISFENNTLEE